MPPIDRKTDGVLLLHGIARASASLGVMERACRARGYATLNLDYPARKASLEDLAALIAPRVAAFGGEVGRLHMITHSMGGLLARALVTRHRPARLGRVVMLGPPNGGSEIADLLHRTLPYRRFFGPAGAQLTTRREPGLEALLGPVDYPLGIIAGTRSLNPIESWLILPGPNDGRVTVARTKVTGMAAHIALPATHGLMMRSRRVVAAALGFLREGRFPAEAAAVIGASPHVTVSMAQPDPRDPPLRLELRALSLRFGRTLALDRVSLGVRAGEIIALLGDSGCGKSTLLRAVAGLEEPDSGLIALDGVTLDRRAPPESRGVGLMFQDHALFPHLTLAENVRFGLSRLPKAEARSVAEARLAQVRLSARADDYPSSLSGGESQRVALARALAPGPRVLLLDEPFSNLDRRNRERVRADTVSVLRATGATALLVTHDPEEALIAADRIALMRAGRIVQIGDGADLYHRPASLFAARFFGDLVEIPGRCHDCHVATPFGPLPAPGFAKGAPVTACLRPEAIRLSRPGSGLNARVLERRFLGADSLLVIAIAGLAAPLRIAAPSSQAFAVGDAVGLSLERGGAFVFAADDA